jgi:Arc/MetJ-type ribon-helix-helix transcriptional regulator
MTIHVSKDVERSINAAVQSGQFASADEMVDTLVREYVQRHQEPEAAAQSSSDRPSTPPKRKPLWERAAELRQSIPAEEWDKLPTDGARQLDHYIYGSPKRTDA